MSSVSLGPLKNEHAEIYYRWRNDPRVYKWCRQYEPLIWDNHVMWLESSYSRSDIAMYEILAKGQVVGVCGLTDIDAVNSRAEFSLYIGPEYQRKGYAKKGLAALLDKAFYTLNFNLVWGETFEGNSAAIIFESLGFKKEGTRRSFYYREGKYIDAHLYSIKRSEWSL